MNEQLWFTQLLNKLFAGPANALLHALHVSVENPAAPIDNTLSMELLVFLFLIIVFALIRTSFSVERPGGLQHTLEWLHEVFDQQGHDIIGHGSEAYTAFAVSIFLFVLFTNLLGIIPGFASPTADPVVPLGLAVVTFIYYHWHGFRQKGLWGYTRHFMGPFWWMLPIELISHTARVMSLTIRLYANIFAGDMVTLVFFSLIPVAIPIAFLGLHIGVSLLQAYIFALLASIYIGGAVAEEH